MEILQKLKNNGLRKKVKHNDQKICLKQKIFNNFLPLEFCFMSCDVRLDNKQAICCHQLFISLQMIQGGDMKLLVIFKPE